MSEPDIVEELLDWAEIIDGANNNNVAVLMLSGEVHRDAAKEITRLRQLIADGRADNVTA